MTETDPEISVTLKINGSHSAEIHTVPIGLSGLPVIIIRASENEDSVNFEVVTGNPFVSTIEGVSEIADVLEGLVEVFRSDDFVASWSARRAEAELDEIDTDEEPTDG